MRDADYEFRLELAASIKRYEKRYGKNRQDIAVELTDRLGRLPSDQRPKRPITESMLNEFTRSIQMGRESHLPAAWLAALCDVLRDDALARLVLPEHLRSALVMGEAVRQCPDRLEQALAELRKYSPKPKKEGKGRARG